MNANQQLKDLKMKAKPKSTLNQEGSGYRVFTVFNTILMCLVLLITLYPIYYVVAASISNADQLMRHGGLLLYPLGKWNLFSYELVFRNPMVLGGFANTLFILIVGLCFNMVLTCLGAYLLCLRGSMFVRPISLLILFTMYFSGGMIPAYMNIRDLGMMNTLWSLIIPGAISTYNMLVMRSAFAAVPSTLYEAAYLDGASHPRILTQVYLPLSGATLAVMVLYYAVGHWNSWFSASIYLSDASKYPLQLVLRQILILNQNTELNASVSDTGELAKYADQVKYALIVVSSAPILMLYPFLQKFFTKGVMVGALKG